MGDACFIGWLAQEVESAQTALLTRIEQLDTLRYLEAPRLQQEYMVKIGTVEEEVLAAELDARMLQRKLELIQIRINRREPLDMDAIDRQIETERQSLLAKAEAADSAGQAPVLSADELSELQRIYHRIVERFHPQVHPDVTGTEKTLYGKAVTAYQHQNLAELQLIEEILFKHTISLTLEVSLGMDGGGDPPQEKAAALADMLTADYTLASRLYPYFAPLEKDAVLRSAAEECTARRAALEEQIEQLQQAFPFTAASTLADPEKTNAYLDQLRLRRLRAEDTKKKLTQQLARITEELPYAGK